MKANRCPTLNVLLLVGVNFGKMCFVSSDRFILEFAVHAGPTMSIGVALVVVREMALALEGSPALVTDKTAVRIVGLSVYTQALKRREPFTTLLK